MDFTDDEIERLRLLLDEANNLSSEIYKSAPSSPIKKQLKQLISTVRKARVELSTAAQKAAVKGSSIALSTVPLFLPEDAPSNQRSEQATTTELHKYGVETYVTKNPNSTDVLLLCDCEDEHKHYHMCTDFDWDRYLNNKRRFRPGKYTPE